MGYIIRNGIKYFGDNAVELTQAQYDALPSSKLTDGVDYYITDAQAGAPLATEIAMSTSDNTSVASKLNNIDLALGSIGTITNAAWIATQSSGNGIKLTNAIVLDKGVYILEVQAPNADNSIAFISRNADTYSELQVGILSSLTSCTVFLELVETIRIEVVSAQSSTVNFTYINRGYLRAIKIS